MIPNDHFKQDGICDCPKDGRCIDCDKPCNDHDLVADYHWCDICLSKSWEKYESRKRDEAERKK